MRLTFLSVNCIKLKRKRWTQCFACSSDFCDIGRSKPGERAEMWLPNEKWRLAADKTLQLESKSTWKRLYEGDCLSVYSPLLLSKGAFRVAVFVSVKPPGGIWLILNVCANCAVLDRVFVLLLNACFFFLIMKLTEAHSALCALASLG